MESSPKGTGVKSAYFNGQGLTEEITVIGAVKFETQSFVLVAVMSPHQYVVSHFGEAGYAGIIDILLNILTHPF
jgi:hypothetical protein